MDATEDSAVVCEPASRPEGLARGNPWSSRIEMPQSADDQLEWSSGDRDLSLAVAFVANAGGVQ